VCFFLTWILGVSSAHWQKESLAVIFLLVLFLLCVAVIVRCLADAQVRYNLRRIGKSRQEIGEERYNARQNGHRAISTLSRRPTLASAHSRKSIVSHNQVAPHSITPVEDNNLTGAERTMVNGGSSDSSEFECQQIGVCMYRVCSVDFIYRPLPPFLSFFLQ